jgi:uncharacterized membrane protein
MDLFKIVLPIHILAGTVSLLLGSVVLIKRKGDAIHKKSGLIFTIAMIITGLSAFIISYIHPNLFLFIVGVFTIYLASTGFRMIALKNIHKGQKASGVDYLLTLLMFLASLSFLYIGIKNTFAGNNFGIILSLFGAVSLRFCFVDYRNYTGKTTDKLAWLKNHIGRMIGAYIAAFTAFIVVNNTFLPDLIAWSLPTIVGLYFIFRTIKKISHQPLNN